MNSAIEIINLVNGQSYEPVWISNDRREQDPAKTSMKYAQVGGPAAVNKIGNAYGPIYKVEFVSLAITGATHVKIWGLLNDDDNAPVYPLAYLIANPQMEIWLKKFEFTNSAGATTAAGGTFSIIGHRKKQYPMVF